MLCSFYVLLLLCLLHIQCSFGTSRRQGKQPIRPPAGAPAAAAPRARSSSSSSQAGPSGIQKEVQKAGDTRLRRISAILTRPASTHHTAKQIVAAGRERVSGKFGPDADYGPAYNAHVLQQIKDIRARGIERGGLLKFPRQYNNPKNMVERQSQMDAKFLLQFPSKVEKGGLPKNGQAVKIFNEIKGWQEDYFKHELEAECSRILERMQGIKQRALEREAEGGNKYPRRIAGQQDKDALALRKEPPARCKEAKKLWTEIQSWKNPEEPHHFDFRTSGPGFAKRFTETDANREAREFEKRQRRKSPRVQQRGGSSSDAVPPQTQQGSSSQADAQLPPPEDFEEEEEEYEPMSPGFQLNQHPVQHDRQTRAASRQQQAQLQGASLLDAPQAMDSQEEGEPMSPGFSQFIQHPVRHERRTRAASMQQQAQLQSASLLNLPQAMDSQGMPLDPLMPGIGDDFNAGDWMDFDALQSPRTPGRPSPRIASSSTKPPPQQIPLFLIMSFVSVASIIRCTKPSHYDYLQLQSHDIEL